ncbi:MAG: DUF2961 domain-containing protein [Planctomycetota bacterium]|nr:DUF2961 domain-containing protein [Planctomycetota bacterium]
MFTSLFGITHLASAQTRCLTAENVYGEKGKGGMAEVSSQPQEEVLRLGQRWDGPNSCARDLGRGWKVRPCITLPKETVTAIMDVPGPGVIQHIWITVDQQRYRDLILRMYWDGEKEPSVEAPVGDFFCNGWKTRHNILALPINVNPSGAFNCFFPMPFRKHARITVENRAPVDQGGFFYAITYALGPVAESEAYFHARFRRTNPLPYKSDYVILDNVKGQGHYVGTYLAWQQNADGWWGEGEFKAFIDGDAEFPTICGTGTEDYFGGAWGFGQNFSAPFFGYQDLTALTQPGHATNRHGNRHSMYRFHILDPIRFKKDIRVIIQALGWRSEGRYLPLQDDISSVASWYQTEPHLPFPALADRDALEVI